MILKIYNLILYVLRIDMKINKDFIKIKKKSKLDKKAKQEFRLLIKEIKRKIKNI